MRNLNFLQQNLRILITLTKFLNVKILYPKSTFIWLDIYIYILYIYIFYFQLVSIDRRGLANYWHCLSTAEDMIEGVRIKGSDDSNVVLTTYKKERKLVHRF